MSDKQLFAYDRRAFHHLVLSGMGVAAASSFAQTTTATEPEQHPQSCGEAVQRLISGNARFVSGKLRHPHSSEQWRERLTTGQQPFATILGCSDSRVPPEILFDQGFGDLFVIRVAGNVVDADVTGSVEYGVDHLKTRVVIVMGHEGCGAVTAALQSKDKQVEEPKEIQSLLSKITPALRDLTTEGEFDARLASGVDANVRWSVQQLNAIPDLAKAVRDQRTIILGCVYDLRTGRVRTL